MFQYNDCLGSSARRLEIFSKGWEFQYNDCLGSSKGDYFALVAGGLFQYNDCLGSSSLLIPILTILL